MDIVVGYYCTVKVEYKMKGIFAVIKSEFKPCFLKIIMSKDERTIS